MEASAAKGSFRGDRKNRSVAALPPIQTEVANTMNADVVHELFAAPTANHHDIRAAMSGEPLKDAARGELKAHQFRTRRDVYQGPVEI